MIYLIAPPIGDTPTGGSLYNHYITSDNEFVTLLEVTEVTELINFIAPNSIVIIDSLLLEAYFKSHHASSWPRNTKLELHIVVFAQIWR